MFKKIRKLLGIACMVVSLVAGSAVPVAAEVDTAAGSGTFPVESDSWPGWPQAAPNRTTTACLLDLNTGAILYAKGMDVQRFPASITKIMTALLVAENADLNAQVAFTETGLADAYSGSSNINPQVGEVFTIDQMLQMLLVKSANDVATQLAESLSGSVEAFAEIMNQRAAELGCTNTHFANANGLEDDNHYTSAHDMALIMRQAIQYDRIREIMASPYIEIPETNFTGTRYYDTHLVMLTQGSDYYYEGALGGKTGYTPISGCTLVMYASREGRNLIGVVMGGGDSNLIADDMADLFDYGFYSFSQTDMTSGYPHLAGGTALLPNGMDSSLVNMIPTEVPEGVSLAYLYNGQILGSGLVAKDIYDSWQADLNPQPEPQPEETAIENAEQADGQELTEEAPQEVETNNTGKKSGRVIGMYIAMAVLAISILCCIVLIVLTSEGHQKKMRNRKK